MSPSLTDRLLELNNAKERALITEEEYKVLRTRLLESFTTLHIPPPHHSLTPSASSHCADSPISRRGPPVPPPRTSSVINLIPISENQSSSLANTVAENTLRFSPIRPTHIQSPPSSPPSSLRTSCFGSVVPRATSSTSQSSPRQPVNTQRNIRAFSMSEDLMIVPSQSSNSNQQSSVASGSTGQSAPEIPPPPYSPPGFSEQRRRHSTNFFKQKSSAELRKELKKLSEDAKKEQDSWKREEIRLSMRIGTKPEEIERIKRKMRESTEKYKRKMEAVNAKLALAILAEQTTNRTIN